MATTVQKPTQEKLQTFVPVVVDAQASGQCANQRANAFATSHLQVQPDSPSQPKTISLRVQSCAGRSWELEMSEETSVRELQAMVGKRSGLPADKQLLYLNNQILQEGKTLGQYHLKSKVTILVVHKVYGG